jgi:hypothetical protein
LSSKPLDLDDWPEYSIGVGQDISLNGMLKLAEEIRSKLINYVIYCYFYMSSYSNIDRRFQVSYDSVEKLRAGHITILSIPKDAPYSAQEL